LKGKEESSYPVLATDAPHRLRTDDDPKEDTLDREQRLQRHRRPLLIVPAALLLAGCAPDGVTEQGRDIQGLYNFFLIAAAVVFLLVTGLLIWSVIRYRRRGEELPPQIHGNNKLELTWTILPAILVVVLFIATIQTQNRVTALSDQPAVTIDVLGFQWQWQFNYSGPDGTPGPKVLPRSQDDIPTLRVPEDETIRFRLSSSDVTHSFFVPKALFKRMAVPGRTSEFDMTFDTAGRYPGNCTQYCGLLHDRMVFNVEVMPKAEFDTWYDSEQARAAGAGA
jgi:cytochrome c oxidase subunit 2